MPTIHVIKNKTPAEKVKKAESHTSFYRFCKREEEAGPLGGYWLLCHWEPLNNIIQDPKGFSKKYVLRTPTYRQIHLFKDWVTDCVKEGNKLCK